MLHSNFIIVYYWIKCPVADVWNVLKFKSDNFCQHISQIFCEIAPGWMLFSIGSGNGLVSSGNKLLFEALLTKSFRRYMASLAANELTMQ